MIRGEIVAAKLLVGVGLRLCHSGGSNCAHPFTIDKDATILIYIFWIKLSRTQAVHTAYFKAWACTFTVHYLMNDFVD